MKRYIVIVLLVLLAVTGTTVTAASYGTTPIGSTNFDGTTYQYIDFGVDPTDSIWVQRDYWQKYTRRGNISNNWRSSPEYDNQYNRLDINNPADDGVFKTSAGIWFDNLLFELTYSTGYYVNFKQQNNKSGYIVEIVNEKIGSDYYTTLVDIYVIVPTFQASKILVYADNDWYGSDIAAAYRVGFRLEQDTSSGHDIGTFGWYKLTQYYQAIQPNGVVASTTTQDIPLGYGELEPSIGLMYKRSNDYQRGFDDGRDEGFAAGEQQGYQEGYQDGYNDADEHGGVWQLIWSAFMSVFGILSIEIFPKVTLGMIAMIPIVFGLIAFLLNLGGGKND